MAIADTGASIVFKNLNVSFNNTSLLNDATEQASRLADTEARRRLFKTDFMVLAEGDLWSSLEMLDRRDFLVVSGILNYAQAITHRLMTPRGYHPADPTFGVPWYDYLGQSYVNKSVIEAQLSSEVASEIMRDPRTNIVRSATAKFVTSGEINIACVVIPATTNTDSLGISLTAGV